MADHPWFGILLTLGAWSLARRLRAWTKTPLLDPVLLSVASLILVLLAFDVPYESYDVGGRVISFLLGPAVVALAVPLVRQLERIRHDFKAIAAGVGAGCLVGIGSAAGLGWVFGASPASVLSLAPKSVTTPIALELSARIGGVPPVTIALVVVTGILGGMIGPQFIRWLGIRSPLAAGLAVGTAAHGIGTARAVSEGETEGAMSGIGMTLNGLLTALVLPLLVYLLT